MEQTTLRQLRYSTLGEQLTDPAIVHLMANALSNPHLLSLAAGFTDNMALPLDLVQQVVTEVAARPGGSETLQYGMNSGRPGLRRAVVRLLKGFPGEPSMDLDENSVLITNGSQQALYIATQVLCDPGDIVLVEKPTYFVYLEVLKGLGAQPVSMPSLADGSIDFDALRALINRLCRNGNGHRLKAVYLVSYHANPSTRCIPEEDKRNLGNLLQTLDFALPVIEDAAYRDLYFEETRAARSIIGLPEFAGLPCLYAGTFTKPFSTGLKVGYTCCTDSQLLGKMLNVKGQQDFGTSNFTQAIIETVLEDGRYTQYLRKLRPHYARKMQILNDALEAAGLRQLGWTWDFPDGGFLLWAKAPDGFDTRFDSPFYQACLSDGVLYVPGDLCFAEGSPFNFVRLSAGVLSDERLQEAAKSFVNAARRLETV